MPQPQRGGPSLELDGGALGLLAFVWSGDRYAHHWRFPDELSEISIQSLESGSEVTWPVSPPLQQIHRQSFADGREIVFGVGMAGRGHWSASFTLVPELRCWIVELACRAAVMPENLASSYRLAGNWTQLDEHRFGCNRAQSAMHIEAIATSAGGSAELSEGVLRIAPAPVDSTPASTQQWAFKLTLPKN